MLIVVVVDDVAPIPTAPDDDDDADVTTADVDDDVVVVLLWLLFPPPLWLQLHSVLSKSLVSVNGNVALQKAMGKRKKEKRKTLQQKTM